MRVDKEGLAISIGACAVLTKRLTNKCFLVVVTDAIHLKRSLLILANLSASYGFMRYRISAY